MNTLTIMSADKATRAEYYARLRDLNDMRANKAIGYKEGHAEGLAQGRTEERAEAAKREARLRAQAVKREAELAKQAEAENEMRMQTARGLLAIGISLEQVAQISGLSIEEVKKL